MTDSEFKAEVLKAALSYAERGWAVFPCYTIGADGTCTCGKDCGKDVGKHPIPTNGFKAAKTDTAQIQKWFGPEAKPCNLAIATGARSGITVIDIDTGEGKVGAQTWAELIAEKGEPVTLMARTGSGGMHLFFSYCSAVKDGTNRLGKNVDVKNDGGYVIAAPSRHKSGGAYAWLNWGTALAVLPEHLAVPKETPRPDDPTRPPCSLAKVKEMLAVIPAEDRDLWRAVGIILGREFKCSDEAWTVYEEWAAKWDGEKERGHDKIMHEAFYEVSQKPAQGKELSMGTLIKLAKEHGWVPSSITGMNKTYAVVWLGGDCKILREHLNPDTQRPDVSFASLGAVKLFHADAPMILVGKKWVHPVDQWITDKACRRYEGVTFLPGPTPEGFYNLWRGFAVEPREGECNLMKAHMKDVICAGNDEYAKYLTAWCANVVQRPTFRPGVAVVMRGREGIGKGQFASHFGSLFVPHFVPLTKGHHLTGHFNSLLKDALVVYADEAFWAGDKQGEGTLKALITEDTHQIELKGIDPVQVKNYIHLIVASNHDWVVPAGSDARRFFVLDVTEAHKEDREYFAELNKQMDNGGREAFLYYLQQHDYRDVDLRRVPKTAALMDQKLQSMTPVEKWWYGVLNAGELVWDDKGNGTEPHASALYELYIHDAKEAGVTRRSTEMELAKTLKVLVPGMKKTRPHVKDGAGNLHRVRAWKLPSLKECRKAFDTRMSCTPDWEEAEKKPKKRPTKADLAKRSALRNCAPSTEKADQAD